MSQIAKRFRFHDFQAVWESISSPYSPPPNFTVYKNYNRVKDSFNYVLSIYREQNCDVPIWVASKRCLGVHIERFGSSETLDLHAQTPFLRYTDGHNVPIFTETCWYVLVCSLNTKVFFLMCRMVGRYTG